ncbi:Fatty acid hydroxylase [Mycena venus]|uniref:Fatty acid hydroxylase n=1 Tax=Mycena venus TaxID=2733690 RepID=A0A8H6X3C0_9AGAR|nr:Fatty acid hydroxylase [Mycena venus]
MSVRIPQPPTIPFIGNVTSIEPGSPQQSFELLAKKYGEIYQIDLLGNKLIFVSSYALANEVSDETRFQKRVAGGLWEVRNLVGDALLSKAQPEEPNWGIAHRLLMPAFGTIAVKGMMEEMRDISNQLILKVLSFSQSHILIRRIDIISQWERFAFQPVALRPGLILLLDSAPTLSSTLQMTLRGVALDTIAYCSMSYRLNSFYREGQPEFAVAMGDFLLESGKRSARPRVVQAMMRGTTAKYQADIKLMRDLAEKIVSTRRENPIPKHDLLDTMLNSRDPKTGQAMTEESISQNLLTFLIAGHETSSGMYLPSRQEEFSVFTNAQYRNDLRAQIDEVLGTRPIQYEDFASLPYLIAVMRETLRLTPTAPGRATSSLEDTTIGGGKYKIKKGEMIVVMSGLMQQDPSVWGSDADQFRPERMLDGKFEVLPPNAWQPFGFGARACIGRAFAWQEVCLVMASIIQRFDLSLDDPSYTLRIKETLTIKPADLRIRASPRNTGVHLYASPSSTLMTNRDTAPASKVEAPQAQAGLPFYVLYGSNTGTSEAFAQRVASEAPSYGFRPSIGTLDSATGNLPKDGPVIIITASFEGEPADNAVRFIDWLRNIDGNNEFDNVRFAVFGCGNSDWTATFQKIPILCDELLEKNGGRRLLARGWGDASSADFFQMFDEFEAKLWVTLSKEYSTSRSASLVQGLEVKTVDAGKERAAALRQADALLGRVVENRVLTKTGPVKRHIEFELPEGITARAGDYVAILPQNPIRDVRRVLARFGLSNEEEVVLSSVGPTSLPVGKPVKLWEILSGYTELSQPATRKDLGILEEVAAAVKTRSYLAELKASYNDAVLAKRLSVFEILESHPDIALSIGTFLQMLPSMRVRQYSISSSPLWNPTHVTVTISVLDAPALTGSTAPPFLGVGSNYLAGLIPGDRVQMSIRPSAAAFHPPENPALPVVMFCAGSGLAPMRGFIQERAEQKASGRSTGKMLLFFGCRSPDTDFLYSDSELAEWIKSGVVDVRTAFSRSSEDSEGCKYVQHRVWNDRADIVEAYKSGASFFTCGSAHVAKEIKATLVDIFKTEDNLSLAEANERFEKITKGRYATDIFD